MDKTLFADGQQISTCGSTHERITNCQSYGGVHPGVRVVREDFGRVSIDTWAAKTRVGALFTHCAEIWDRREADFNAYTMHVTVKKDGQGNELTSTKGDFNKYAAHPVIVPKTQRSRLQNVFQLQTIEQNHRRRGGSPFLSTGVFERHSASQLLFGNRYEIRILANQDRPPQ